MPESHIPASYLCYFDKNMDSFKSVWVCAALLLFCLLGSLHSERSAACFYDVMRGLSNACRTRWRQNWKRLANMSSVYLIPHVHRLLESQNDMYIAEQSETVSTQFDVRIYSTPRQNVVLLI